jgi:hypothetical protein
MQDKPGKIVSTGRSLRNVGYDPKIQDLADQLLFLAAVGGTLRLEA